MLENADELDLRIAIVGVAIATVLVGYGLYKAYNATPENTDADITEQKKALLVA